MRAIWTGSITFGLITIPVMLDIAVGRKKDIATDKDDLVAAIASVRGRAA